MNLSCKNLNIKELKDLRKYFSVQKMNSEAVLIYESQIPNMGILLINGEINLKKKTELMLRSDQVQSWELQIFIIINQVIMPVRLRRIPRLS